MINLEWHDLLLILAFVALNIGLGFYTRGIAKNFDEYVNGRNTKCGGFTIVSTIVALFCSASLFVAGVEEMYLQQYFIFFSYFIAEMVACVVTIYIYIPKIIKIKTLSLHEYIGHFYGDNIRCLFAFCETIQRTGRFALQLLLIEKCTRIAFEINHSCNSLMFIITFFMILYASYGGIVSVSRTDIVQFISFFIIIIVIVVSLWQSENELTGGIYCLQKVFDTQKYPKMSFKNTFNSLPVIIGSISMLTRSALATPLNIPYFQRIAMCITEKRAKRLWSIGTFFYGFVILCILTIGLQLLGLTEGSDPLTGKIMRKDRIIPTLMYYLNSTSLKMLFLICIISLSVSTSDSEFNGISTLLTNDVLPRLKKGIKKTRRVAVSSSIVCSFVSLGLAVYFNDIYKLLISVQNFFQPIVVVPLSATVLGLRTHKNCVWIAVICGALMTITYPYLLPKGSEWGMYAFGPGMFANAAGLFASHLYYKKVLKWKWEGTEPTKINEKKEEIENEKKVNRMLMSARCNLVLAIRNSITNKNHDNISDRELALMYFNHPIVRNTNEYKIYKGLVFNFILKKNCNIQDSSTDSNSDFIEAIKKDLEKIEI